MYLARTRCPTTNFGIIVVVVVIVVVAAAAAAVPSAFIAMLFAFLISNGLSTPYNNRISSGLSGSKSGKTSLQLIVSSSILFASSNTILVPFTVLPLLVKVDVVEVVLVVVVVVVVVASVALVYLQVIFVILTKMLFP